MERIALADKFFEKVKDGTKTSTIRYGLRPYKLGECEFYSDTQSIMVKIIMVGHCAFSGLTIHDAKREGYETKEELQEAIREFYPTLKDKDIITTVWFELLKQG